jgi:hypothetical protein
LWLASWSREAIYTWRRPPRHDGFAELNTTADSADKQLLRRFRSPLAPMPNSFHKVGFWPSMQLCGIYGVLGSAAADVQRCITAQCVIRNKRYGISSHEPRALFLFAARGWVTCQQASHSLCGHSKVCRLRCMYGAVVRPRVSPAQGHCLTVDEKLHR